MITDKIENAYKYSEIPQIVKDFLINLTSDVQTGKIILNDDIYVNIEKYLTKKENDGLFEAHEKFIDIQVLLEGSENIYFTDKSELSIKESYDDLRDIEFYSENISYYQRILLNGSNFVMLFPHEAHAPQICVNNKQTEVKKAVIKIKI